MSFRFLPSALMILVGLGGLVALTGCQNAQNLGSGTAEGFGGGDLLVEQLREVRNDIIEKSLVEIATAPVSESLCDFQNYCSLDNAGMCLSAPSLTSNQKLSCNNFIRTTVSDLLAAVKNSDITFEVVNENTFDNGQAVTARTELSRIGKIWVSYPRVIQSTMSKYELAALITHEFLHKVKIGDRFQDDEDSVESFPQASTLFTAVGYALAFRHQARKNVLVGGVAPAKSFMGSGLTTFTASQTPRAIADEPSLQFTGDFSWSFVLQTLAPQTDLTTFTNVILTKGTLRDPIAYGCEIHNQLSLDKGRIECGQKNAGSLFPDTLKTASRLDDGRPHHIVFSRAGSAMRIYVDGFLNAERILLLPPNNSQNALPLSVGHRDNASRFSGNLGLFYFWTKSFTPNDIGNLKLFMSELIPGFLSAIFGIR